MLDESSICLRRYYGTVTLTTLSSIVVRVEVSVLANKCFIGVKYTIRIPNTVDAVVGDVVNLAQYPHKIVATRIRPKVERSTAEFFDIVAGTKALSYLTGW
jgi:hypothetical protein